MNPSFEQEWAGKLGRVRSSLYWKHVSSPPLARVIPAARLPPGHVALDASWGLALEGAGAGGPAAAGVEDLRRMAAGNFGIRFARRPDAARTLRFTLRPPSGTAPGRWDRSFSLEARPDGVTVTAASEGALLRASLYLSNYWRLIRAAALPAGRRTVRPAIPVHIAADLWGGFSTTQAWVHGREDDANFIELARMGVTVMPVMTLLEDTIADAAPPFASLVNGRAAANRRRLRRLVEAAARQDIGILLMGYNPKLPPDHRVFADHPASRGALQAGGAFRVLCAGDPRTRRFLAGAWASLFEEIPALAGVLAISGGEGFYHCFMRNSTASDCPRCSRRSGAEAAAELVNAVAAAVRAKSPQALFVTWPYSAFHWSGDRDQRGFIARLDPRHVHFQTEIDKDSVDWREAGYGKYVWDYSLSGVPVSARCRAQRTLTRRRGLPFSVKIECNNAIECLNVPYLPVLDHQAAAWEGARRLRPAAIHSRWMFDGSCKSPSEELGYWMLWGGGTPFNRPPAVLEAIARREYGEAAAPAVRAAWHWFSKAMRHHPSLDYYKGSYFIGPAQPLVLDPARAGSLDPAFDGRFYWEWEVSASRDATSLVRGKPLFYAAPAFRALARRGPDAGRDVALDELRRLAQKWEQGARRLEGAGHRVPPACRARWRREWILGRHLALTWRSAANVEEFLRLRDMIREFSASPSLRAGHWRENRRDLARMETLARDELRLAREDLALVKGVDWLNQSLRLDMGTASQETMLEAKIRQVSALLKADLPRFRLALQAW